MDDLWNFPTSALSQLSQWCTAFTDGNVGWTAGLPTYSYNKDTDLYAAVADIKLSNTAPSSAIAGNGPISNNQLMGVGVRYKFLGIFEFVCGSLLRVAAAFTNGR